MINRKNAARLIVRSLNNNTRARKTDYDRERKKAIKLFRNKKREHLRHRMKAIEDERLTQKS